MSTLPPPPPYDDRSWVDASQESLDPPKPLSPLSPPYPIFMASPPAPVESPVPFLRTLSRSDSAGSTGDPSSGSPTSLSTRRPHPLQLSKAISWRDNTVTDVGPHTAVSLLHPLMTPTAAAAPWVADQRAFSPLAGDSGSLPPLPLRSPTAPLYLPSRGQVTHRNVGASPPAINSTLDPGIATTSAFLSDSGPPLSAPRPRSATQGSPCLVHSHLDNSLNEFIAKKDAKAALKRKQARAKGKEKEDDESDTASDGCVSPGAIDEDDDEDAEEPSLTRQLAETAVSVREMSKQLGRARVVSHVQSVLIITKARDNHLIRLTRELALWLMLTPRNGRDRGLVVYVDTQLRKSKRFDAEGLERDHAELFRPLPRRYSRTSSSVSLATTNVLDPLKRALTPLSTVGDSIKRPNDPEHVRKGEEEGQLRYWTNEMCAKSPHLFDFVVTLGGDGTVLYASWLFQHVVPPVVPFALGSLGFLTNFDFSHYAPTLTKAIDSGIRVNLRMRFTCTVYRAIEGEENKKRRAVRSGKTGGIFMNNLSKGGWEAIESGGNVGMRSEGRKDKEIKCFSTRPVESFEVLNDLVVDRGPSPYVSLLELFGDEHHMTTVQADGLTVSTPTGSTAYSLSAGGSLVHPEVPALLITPICPHTLSFRPMLLPDSMELRICVPYNSRSTAWASFDGRGRVELRQGDHIKVTASRYPFPTVCADNQSTDWFNSIARTLKWNERQRQKSFVILEEGPKKSKRRASSTALKNPAETPLHKQGAVLSATEQAREDFGDEEDEVDNVDEEDNEATDDDDEEEEEEFDIDDLSSNTTTSASSPVVTPSDPSGTVPPVSSYISPTNTMYSSPSSDASRSRQTSSMSSSIDLEESNDRFGVPRPRPPRLSARHSYNDHSVAYDHSPVSAPPNIKPFPTASLSTGRRRERGEEGVRDYIHEEHPTPMNHPRKLGKSRSPSRDRHVHTVVAEEHDGDVSEPGRAFAVLGVDSDSSSLSGSETDA